jgi:hypothetical protein
VNVDGRFLECPSRANGIRGSFFCSDQAPAELRTTLRMKATASSTPDLPEAFGP